MSSDKKSIVKAGANKQNRTADLFLTKEVLYQLSYVGFVHHPLRGKEPLTQYPFRLQGKPSGIVQESIKPCQCAVLFLSKTEFRKK